MPAIGPYAYPFDPTGQAVTNLVTNEVQTVTAVNSNEYHIVVPHFAPFFKPVGGSGIQFVVRNGATMTPLTEGVHFLFTHKYKEATINTAIPIYGSITLLDKTYAGSLVFEYQTVGGQWTLTTTQINEILSDKLLNPRITTWEQLGNTPEHFPVTDHMHIDPEELIGMPELVEAVENIGLAISGIEVTIDYGSVNAYADSKVQDSMDPSQTTIAPSVRAVLDALANLQVGVHIGVTPPTSPVVKQLWWNSSIGRMFIYYNDGDSTQWVETSPGGGGSGTSARIHVGAIAPTDPVQNQLWWNSETLKMFIYYNDAVDTNIWVEVISTGAQSATVYVGPSAPASPLVNQLWWHSDLGRMFIYYQDSDGYQWVETNPNNSGADGILPVGSVIAGATEEPGPGFLHCRGEVVSRTTFPQLFDAIGTTYNTGGELITEFRLPNLQGQFLRGLDINAGIDPGRSLGDFQEDMFESHTHGGTEYAQIGVGTSGWAGVSGSNGASTTGATGGTETRPKNVSVNYFIKAYSAVQNPGEVSIPSMASDISNATWKLAVETDLTIDLVDIEALNLPTSTMMIKIVMADLISQNSTGSIAVVLGHASGYVSTGYKGRVVELSNGSEPWLNSALIHQSTSASEDAHGIIDIVRIGNSNKWALTGMVYDHLDLDDNYSNGSINLGFPITKVKLTHGQDAAGSPDGNQKFISGNVAIWYL